MLHRSAFSPLSTSAGRCGGCDLRDTGAVDVELLPVVESWVPFKNPQGFPGDSSRDSWIDSQTVLVEKVIVFQKSQKGHELNHLVWSHFFFVTTLDEGEFVTKNTESRRIWHTFRRWILAFLSHGIEKNKEDYAFLYHGILSCFQEFDKFYYILLESATGIHIRYFPEN